MQQPVKGGVSRPKTGNDGTIAHLPDAIRDVPQLAFVGNSVCALRNQAPRLLRMQMFQVRRVQWENGLKCRLTPLLTSERGLSCEALWSLSLWQDATLLFDDGQRGEEETRPE